MRRFELVEDGSKKFWQIEISGSTVTVRFGRLGTEGQKKDKKHPSAAVAEKEAAKLVAQKTKKGYVEVTAKPGVAATSAPANERRDLELAKKSFAELEESTYGELTFTNEPSIVGTFLTDPDAELWTEVFSSVEWIAEEADGGAVGYFTQGGQTVVLYLDNEGSFHVTGLRFVDHLGYVASGDDEALRAFCNEQKLAPPMGSAERKALSKKVRLPDALFAELQKAAAKKSATKKSVEKPAKGAKVAKAVKGPRPFARNVAGCMLADGRLFVVTGEDFGKSYDERITKGATFTFDPASSTFTRHAAAKSVFEQVYAPAFAFPTPKGALVIAHPYEGNMLAFEWDAATAQWSKAVETPIRHEFGAVARALPDGGVLLFGGERDAVAVWNGSKWQKLPSIPEARSYDRLVPLGETLWILGGEAADDSYFESTDRTWLLDLRKKKWSEGPRLPRRLSRVHAFARTDGSVVVLDDGAVWTWAGGTFSDKVKLPALDGTYEVHVRIDDDTLISARGKDGGVVRTDLATLTTTEIGKLVLGQSSSQPFALGDGRVLFIGGTLFANNEAEPEIFSLADGRASALPGWEADVARQEKALAKARQKRG